MEKRIIHQKCIVVLNGASWILHQKCSAISKTAIGIGIEGANANGHQVQEVHEPMNEAKDNAVLVDAQPIKKKCNETNVIT
ncbi:hypothetical protein TanjilG_18350 [Lupinus angustifolius]|uniref:Uncharacterized protein n=1 Tax=Lupinus angustifolius TaxID=3871 RepID=A0A1J7HKK7_LUPAN|nr:hypothetical protein TanjilG_18350 [Lupinus angustifolius]